MSRDEYYATRWARINTVAGDAAYYKLLARLSDEYKGQFTDWSGFYAWCKSEHGFCPIFDPGGGVTNEPEVVDDKKYTLCLLKYSG